MIERTQLKLREARFFFHQLLDEARRPDLNEPKAFCFYLSAFLSAARSVTFALQKDQKEKYEAWFSKWRDGLTDEDRQLMDLMKDQRNREQKEGGAEVREDWEFIPLFEARRRGLDTTAPRIIWSGPPGAPPPKIGRRVHYFESEGAEAEVIETCRRYIQLLDRLVQEFIQASTG